MDQVEDAEGNSILTCLMTQQEVDLIREFQDCRPEDQYFDNLIGDDLEHPAWLAFAQHYGVATRLLDVTSDPLVALYFACQEPNGEPGYIWFYPHPTDIHQSHPPAILHEMFDPAISDQQGLAYYRDGRIGEFVAQRGGDRILEASFLFDQLPSNRRIIAQKGAFMWTGNPLADLARNVVGIEISAEAKQEILTRISPFGITAQGLGLTP